MRFFTTKDRPVHLGPYPLERLARQSTVAAKLEIPAPEQLAFSRPEDPTSVINAMDDYQSMLDAVREGLVNPAECEIPEDPTERAQHLKSFAYFSDATMVGVCRLDGESLLDHPYRNPDIERLADQLRTRQTKTLAAGIDMIMADLKEAIESTPGPIDHHTHALVILNEFHRDPRHDEPGTDWIKDAQRHRAALRAAETATVLANYLRLIGVSARAHTASTSEVNLNRLSALAGLTSWENGTLQAPWIGDRFGLAVVTTEFDMAADQPLVPLSKQPQSAINGVDWKIGRGTQKSALNQDPWAKRNYRDGAHPFEKLKRVDDPTTYIDEPRVARVPKRTDMFARAQFGDLGQHVQKKAAGGYYIGRSAPSKGQRRALGALTLLQDGAWADEVHPSTTDAQRNADNIKATAYFLGVDAVGISRCPDWTWYSHDARGDAIDPPHDQAISMIIDQGYETMEGASGDDWISVAQSMRAYLRFSLLGGVMANHIRRLGYAAKAHTVTDGDVLQPPLLLLSGLGEVSRIGEVILNPYLGPRLKSGVVTTTMPVTHDKPIDFGLQKFCESCNKCARECPSGAITAGPKLMFNGYEIWKSDSQKCATYRITAEGGAMCGRCMKTCPWNLEGIFKEKPFRWAAMNMPGTAPLLARLDDAVGNGDLNPVKKWWWDLEVTPEGGYKPTLSPVNERRLQPELDLKHEDQTLAVYPANLAPHPWPYPYMMDREKGIDAYQAMITAEEYQRRLDAGETDPAGHTYTGDNDDSPVIPVVVSKVEVMADDVVKYEFLAPDGSDLPEWQAGAHLDIVVAPEFLRQYSMSGDPADRSVYQVGVLREDEGRGGSKLLHRIFSEGRKIFISKPINHFPLDQSAEKSLLLGGGIGITPMIAMAHELHAAERAFELHYSIRTRSVAGFLDDLANVPWQDSVFLHVSDEGTRLDLADLLAGPAETTHLYVCGPDRYIQGVLEAAEQQGWDDERVHKEFFSVPELPDYENHDFTLRLTRSGRELLIPADKAPTDVLQEAGVAIDVKCSDGLCGVCKCGLVSGEVEHRDFVLSKAQRKNSLILCQSRAAEPGGVIEVDL